MGPHAQLGLAPGASPSDIRRAYRRLAMRLHPDRAGAGTLADFLAVKAAYEALLAERPAPLAAPADDWRSPSPSSRPTPWTGGRWYWEGLRANAARRARGLGSA